MLRSIRVRQSVFLVLQVALTLAALYHFAGLFYKVNDAPFVRHAAFVVIDLFCVYGFRKRPRYIVFFFAPFTLYQYYTHGLHLIRLWTTENRIHWISVLVLAILPVGLIFLVLDLLRSREENQIR